MKIILSATAILLALMAGTIGASGAPDNGSPGHPYGEVNKADVDALAAYAKTKGFDFWGDVYEKAYGRNDAKALGRFFQFSLQLTSYDQNARTYAQVLYSSFLNLGDSWGRDRYSKVLLAQSPKVQQRIRDLLCYPDPVETLREFGEELPEMFPKAYKFGRGDDLFQHIR